MTNELESMLVKLLGDSSSFVNMLKEAQKQTQDAAKSIENEAKKIEGITTSVKGFASAAVSTIAGLGIKGAMQDAFNAFEGRESNMRKLTSSIEANGRAVEATVGDYQTFAKGIAGVTTSSQGATLHMLQQAESMGLTGEAAKRAVQNAIALAAAQGGVAESFIHSTAALENGQILRLDRQLGLTNVTSESEKLRLAQERLGNMFKTATSVAGTSAGQIERLGNAYQGLKADFGEIIDEAIKPMIGYIREGVNWFRSLTKETKTTIVVIAGIALGVVTLSGAIATAGIIFNTMFGGVGILLGVLVTIGTVTAIWIQRVGGLGKAWEIVQEKASRVLDYVRYYWQAFLDWVGPKWEAFMQWFLPKWEEIKTTTEDVWESTKGYVSNFVDYVKPIFLACMSVLIEWWKILGAVAVGTWELIKASALFLWDWLKESFTNVVNFINDKWMAVSGGAKITWESIRDYVRDCIIFFEYTLTHFAQVSDLVWTGVKLYAIKSLNAILNNLWAILAGPIVLPIYAAMMVNWKGIWDACSDYVKDVFKNIFTNIIEFAKKIPEIIAGKVNFADMWAGLSANVNFTAQGVKIPALDALEAQLQAEFDKKKATLNVDFDAFKAQKLKEFANFGFNIPEIPKQVIDKAKDEGFRAGQGVGAAITKGFHSEKVEGALSGSAEALSRIMAYRERLSQQGTANARLNTLTATPVVKDPVANAIRADGMKQLEALQAIREILKKQKLIKVNQVDLR